MSIVAGESRRSRGRRLIAMRSRVRSASMINVKRISHATFETPDIDRQIDYFTQIAGLTLTERENGRAFLATKLADLAVQLEKGDHARSARLAFQVEPDTEFDDIRRGVEPVCERCQSRN